MNSVYVHKICIFFSHFIYKYHRIGTRQTKKVDSERTNGQDNVKSKHIFFITFCVITKYIPFAHFSLTLSLSLPFFLSSPLVSCIFLSRSFARLSITFTLFTLRMCGCITFAVIDCVFLCRLAISARFFFFFCISISDSEHFIDFCGINFLYESCVSVDNIDKNENNTTEQHHPN